MTAPLLVTLLLAASGPEALTLDVAAGRFDRRDCPVRVEVSARRLPVAVCESLAQGPAGLPIVEIGADGPRTTRAQADRVGDATIRLTWVLRGETKAGARRRFRLEADTKADRSSPWSFEEPTGGLVLAHDGRVVFRYNTKPVTAPGFPPIQARDAYIHPAYTPSGAAITGDYSKFHPHHRGFFLAYTKTRVGDRHPDFWNIQDGTGKVHFDRLDARVAGPVTARFVARHRWEAAGAGVALRFFLIPIPNAAG